MTIRLAVELRFLLSKAELFRKLIRNTEVRRQNNKVYLNMFVTEPLFYCGN